jgi:WD40 repeat protein
MVPTVRTIVATVLSCGAVASLAADEPRTFTIKDRQIRALAFSPDGKLLAVGSSATARQREHVDEGIIKLFDLQSGAELATLWHSGRRRANNGTESDTTNEVVSLTFSPDGKVLVGGDQLGYRVWDVATHQEKHVFYDGFSYSGAAFSRDGKLLVIPGNSFTEKQRGIKLIETETGKDVARLPLITAGQFSAMDFSPDGGLLAGCGSNCDVIVWDAATRAPIFKDEVKWVLECVRFSPNGKLLVAAGEGGVLKSYRIQKKEQGTRIDPLPDSPRFVDATYRLVFSGDGKTLFACESQKIGIWNVEPWKKGRTIPGKVLALSRDGTKVAIGDAKRGVVEVGETAEVLKGR